MMAKKIIVKGCRGCPCRDGCSCIPPYEEDNDFKCIDFTASEMEIINDNWNYIVSWCELPDEKESKA